MELTQRHIQALRRCGSGELILAENLEDLARDGMVENVPTSELKVGQTAPRDLISSRGKILLEAGEPIEQHHLDAVEASGNAYLSEVSARRERILMADVLVEQLERRLPNLDLRVKPCALSDWIRPVGADRWPSLDQLEAFRATAVERLRRMFAKIEAGVPADKDVLENILNDLMDYLSNHQTRFPQLALLCRRNGEYLPDHTYTVTILAMAMAAQLKWPEDHVREVGRAGLLFDLGMLMVPERIRIGACELTDMDRQRVNRHPIFGLVMLEAVPDVLPIVQLCAMQHQERENSSGYPYGKRKDAICDYARVLAVADVYAATAEPRHYRKPKLPYAAMEETLRLASAQILWPPAVRALVGAVGLFPVGSYVKLTNGDLAYVLATNPGQIDRPIIQPIDSAGQATDEQIDLSLTPKESLAVVRPIASPGD